MNRYGLVLEGGGLRGAYTAGALAWLNDNDIYLDYGVGISSGALYLICYLQKDKTIPYKMSTEYVADPDVIGFKALLKEKHYVAYKYLYKDVLIEKEHLSLKKLKEENPDMEIGCYDLKEGKTVFFNAQQIDDDMELLLASCALPIASARVTFNGKQYIDGGITKMIPIERSIEKGCNKHLIITTKPEGYVRKPANLIMKLMMGWFYRDCPQEVNDYKIRHLNYNKQMAIIEELVKNNDAILIRPSKTSDVSRFSGNKEELKKLYDLGYQDMESRKEEILSFLGRSNG